MRTEAPHLQGAQEVLELTKMVQQHAEQLVLIKIGHIEQVEVQERYLVIIVHREVAKAIAEQHLVATPLEVEHHLQDIAAHEVIRQEHLHTEALEAELEATVVALEHNQEAAEALHQGEAHTDQVVRAEAAVAIVHRVAQVEARVAPEAQEVLLALRQVEDHQEDDLEVVEAVNKSIKFH